MLESVIAEAFSYPHLMRLGLNVFSFNKRAIRIYERLGFIAEGTRRSSVAVSHERWDTMIMSMLRSEYGLPKKK